MMSVHKRSGTILQNKIVYDTLQITNALKHKYLQLSLTLLIVINFSNTMIWNRTVSQGKQIQLGSLC